MISNMNEHNTTQNFFTKYRKWLIAAVGIQLIPGILLMCSFLGVMIYQVVNSKTMWHPYNSTIVKGFNQGVGDGNKEHGIGNRTSDYLWQTPWYKYEEETEQIKKQILQEKEKLLEQLPENERGAKRAEMRLDGTKLPLEEQLENRFTKPLAFYTDYVEKRIKREFYSSEQEYNLALKKEAWKVGYEYGYGKGCSSSIVRKLD